MVEGTKLDSSQNEKNAGFLTEELAKKFFPYRSFRPFQLNAIKFSFKVINEGKIGLLSSPCGTGKSISVLTAFFMAKDMNNAVGRLVALTRTRNQLEIYCRELQNIKEKCNAHFTASVFKSKKDMCPYAEKEEKRLKRVSYRDFLQYCKGLREGVFGETCGYYENTYVGWKPSWHAYNIINKIRETGPLMPDEVFEICEDKGICPYEATKILARYAEIVIGNYNYILVDAIRKSILGRAGLKPEGINCVFDEAHSLPQYAAGILSEELSSVSIKRAKKEVEIFGLDDSDFLDVLYKVLIDLGKSVYRKYGVDVEGLIEKEEVIKKLSKAQNVESPEMPEIIKKLLDEGEYLLRKRMEMGKTPVSYLFRCASFLANWIRLSGLSYMRYVKVEIDRTNRKRVRLGIKCLDPSLASSIINELRSTILMSGTLWQMDYYMDVLGLERKRCETLELPNPFPPENRIIAVDNSVTTKFEKRSEEQWRNIAFRIGEITKYVSGRIAIYFPSYEIMHKIAEIGKFDLPIAIEEKGTKILDVLQFLRKHKRCAIFGVARGKISEGVDMTDEGKSMLSAVIIVGLPYPKKTELQNAIYKYFREKFGDKAIEYANHIPCLNALAQSAGRLQRSEEDKGVILIMDKRADGPFKRKLPKDWRNSIEPYFEIEEVLEKIGRFYGTRRTI